MLAILAQFLNFVIALTLFSYTKPYEELDYQEQLMKTWLFIEIMYVVSIVLYNTIYMFIRSFQRSSLRFEGITTSKNLDQDFLSVKENQYLVAFFGQPLW